MKSVLFVCLGNICRSPAAEGVLVKMAEDSGFAVTVDSAGTSGYHAGEKADPRMIAHGARRGYNLTSRSRQVKAKDLSDFDLILAMDKSNHSGLRKLPGAERYLPKIKLFCEFCREGTHEEVPDPYYGGEEGFELVYDLLEDGCRGLLDYLKSQP